MSANGFFDFLRQRTDVVFPLVFVAVWLILQLWILPKLGVST